MKSQNNGNEHIKSKDSKGTLISQAETEFNNVSKATKTDVIETPAPASIPAQVLLMLVAIALLLFIQNFLGKAVFEKVKSYKQEYSSGLGKLSKDSLMASRFGLDYLIPSYLASTMKPQVPVLLTPPIAYTKKFIKQQSAHSLTNPLYLFYMNNDIKTVTMGSADITRANCTILIDKEGRCYPMLINNKGELDFALQLFNKGEPYQPAAQ